MKNDIYIIAEHIEGAIRPATDELVPFAKRLAAQQDMDLHILILGNDIDALAAELAEKTGFHVVGRRHEELVTYNQELYTAILGDFFAETPFAYILLPHSTQGMDLAAALAVKTGSACITGVDGMELSGDNGMRFSRSVFNGKASASLFATTRKTVLTVQPGIINADGNAPGPPGQVEMQPVSNPAAQTRSTGLVRARSGSRSIAEADIIISAGRGVGKAENLALLQQLADRFSRSALGASRPLCDLGWLDYQRQIGITGQSVSPELYIACGISGAVQHLSGIRGAGFIVAINTDPKAAIFNMADVCIVEDLNTFIPVLIEALEANSSSG